MYPPLAVEITTPLLSLRGATDDLLAELAPLVRAGEAVAEPPPFDDPMSLYEVDPERRVQRWLQGVWRGRGSVSADLWRLSFVVVHDGRAVGMQDLIGQRFDVFRSATSFSWLARSARGRGLGREMRAAVLHLAFEGLGADRAESEAFTDNAGSNRISQSTGYVANGTTWATRQGSAAVLQRWQLSREDWLPRRRDDISLAGVAACRAALAISARPPTSER
ncbi:GNAT family N-acetyltransferase [Microlunatus capsulatus]|nr:GNAT family protein [Microlunatus capsulatus]